MQLNEMKNTYFVDWFSRNTSSQYTHELGDAILQKTFHNKLKITDIYAQNIKYNL